MAKQLGRCVFDDDVCNQIVEKLNEADALVVGSPVYYGQPNGAVMAVLQRAFFSGAKVQNKPAAAVTICRRGGATAAYQTLNMLFEKMNMPVVTSQYWNIAYGLASGEVAQDTEGMQTMRTLGNNLLPDRHCYWEKHTCLDYAIQMIIFIHFIALILQNPSFVTYFFRNFGRNCRIPLYKGSSGD